MAVDPSQHALGHVLDLGNAQGGHFEHEIVEIVIRFGAHQAAAVEVFEGDQPTMFRSEFPAISVTRNAAK